MLQHSSALNMPISASLRAEYGAGDGSRMCAEAFLKFLTSHGRTLNCITALWFVLNIPEHAPLPRNTKLI